MNQFGSGIIVKVDRFPRNRRLVLTLKCKASGQTLKLAHGLGPHEYDAPDDFLLGKSAVFERCSSHHSNQFLKFLSLGC